MATIEHSLQSTLETIERFLSGTGLDLSPSKSELLLYRQSRQGVRNLEPLQSFPIVIKAKNGQPIRRVDSVKILDLLIDAKGCNATARNNLSGQAGNVIRMITRISNRRSGLREGNLLKSFQPFFLSHITYITPYLNWSREEKAELDALKRTGLKRVLGLPQSTSTKRLLELGFHK